MHLLNIFILPFNSLPSLTLITHFFISRYYLVKKRYNRWVEKLKRGMGGGSHCICCFFTLKHLQIILGNCNEVSLRKITLFFVDSCSAAAWGQNKHNLKLNCISCRKRKFLCILCFYEIPQWRLMGEICYLLAKVTKNNTPTAMLFIYEEQSTPGKIHIRDTYCERNCGNLAEVQRLSEQDCRKPWGKAGTQRSLLVNSFAPQHPRENLMH